MGVLRQNRARALRALAASVVTAAGIVIGQSVGVTPVFAAGLGWSPLAVGVAADGGAGDGSSVPYAITPDGRYVVFSSTSTNLLSVPVSAGQAFIRDMITGVTEIVSVSSAGVPGNSGSHPVAVSPDGRYVTFTSDASNLVAGDTNGNADAFLHDRLLGTTERVSVRADGSQISGGTAGPVSDDGSIVLFGSTGAVTAQDAVYNDGSTYIRNRTARTVTPLLGYRIRNGFPDPYVSDGVSMSGDARYVAFRSRPGLLSSDNTQWQAYLKDLVTGTITRLTNAPDGSPENGAFNNGTISRDGRFFTYTSQATNLDPAHPNSSMSVFLLDRTSGATENVGLGNNGVLNGSAENSSVSADGRYVAFDAYATNVISPATPVGENYAYIRDRVAGTTALVSRTWDGQVPNDHINLGPYALTADGHQLLTYCIATNVFPTPNLSSSQAVLYSTPVDTVAPTVTGSPDRPANHAGWYRAPVTVTWSATDPPPSSGAPTIPPATVVSSEGANQLVTSAPSCDPVGNCATGSYGPINIDLTRPTIDSALAPTPNAAGWVNQPVTVAYTCSDALSGMASCPTPVTVTGEGAAQTVTGTAVDNAGNTATATATVNVDTTAPTITATLSQAANGNGWNNADVTVTFTCIDTLSGVASCPGPVTLTDDGADQVVTGTATDKAGNSSTTTATVSIDKTRPLITAVRTAANSNGWNNTDVTVTYACTDALSGIATCPDPTVLSAQGAGQSATAVATDRAGNTATATVTGINIDKSQPMITAAVTGSRNSAGWYTSAPSIHYTCTDALSGIASCPADITISGDGTNQAVTATAIDKAGNTATATVSGLNVDTTPPLVSITGAVDAATYLLNQLPTPSCITSDATSGVATPATLTSSRTPTGVYTATCTGASDIAGNTTTPVSITYTVTPTAATLTGLTNQYVSASGSPDANGVINDLDNKLKNSLICLYITKVNEQTSTPNPTLTPAQATELTYWAHILNPTC